jgi:thiamine-phosphate diphosphorylase
VEQSKCLLDQVRAAIEAEIDMLQVSERDLSARQLAVLVRAIVVLANGSNTRILVNDRVDVALAAGAAGVHLRGDSISASRARSMAPPGFLIGRSVHDATEASQVGADLDYLVAGTVWATPSKPPGQALLGTEGLAAVVRASTVPVLAVGGVTAERISEVAASGAAGVAAIGLFMPSNPAADKTAERPGRSLRDRAAALRARYDEVVRPHLR